MKKLNKSEVEVLLLTASDLSVKEIANIRRRSVRTVETQSRSIREKMNCHSMAASLARSIKLGIIELHEL